MHKKWILFIVIIFLVVGTVWYTNEKQISSIRLECADLCKKNANISFDQKTFTDKGELRKFKNAIHKAHKISGEIDYGVMFWMYVSFHDGSQKKYVLNINEENKGNALLVNVKGEKGYSVPKDQTEQLRQVIYG